MSSSSRPSRAPKWAPEPPVQLPPGYIVHLPGRGETFVRDTGGDGIPLLLLHGWMFSADLNWFRAYGPLEKAGYRVMAMDHRGHGRGLRTHARFRLEECAHDAAAVLEELGAAPALVCGYSMGGPVTQILARDRPELVRGMVLCATAQEWQDLRMKILWNVMAGVRFALGLAPHELWRRAFRLAGLSDSAATTWITAELTRGSSRDLAEAGRELGRYDSRPWLSSVDVPAAVVVTARDNGVPPSKQRELAAVLDAPTFEVDGDHAVVTAHARRFNGQLLRALQSVRERSEVRAQAA